MELSYELISQFAKQIVKADKKTKSESTVYGTVVADENGKKYVKLDGSDQLTPLTDEERPSVDSTSVSANEGERVSVLIKNHTATVTGNISSPAARSGDVEEIKKFDILIGQQVQANEAYFKKLLGDEATLGKLTASEVSIIELLAKRAEIDALIADKITVTDLIAAKVDADVVIADRAIIESLKSSSIDVLGLLADKAVINRLIAEGADLNSVEAKNAYLRYANVDFANIGEAAIRKIFSESGLISDLVVGDGTITGELVGVTIKGDLIEGNTVKADKLVVKGSDGLYYKLNFEGGTFTDGEEVPDDSLHGSVITAKSITAEKVSVKDLVAFGATIGGFNITDHSLYSGVKSSMDNSTRGIYMDTDSQFNIGDGYNFLRYRREELATADISDGVLNALAIESVQISTFVLNETQLCLVSDDDLGDAQIINDTLYVSSSVYKLEISADSILFGDGSRSSAADLKALTEHVKIGTIVDETGDEKPCVELAEGDSDFKQVITNTKTMFMDGGTVRTTVDKDGIETDNINVKRELRQSGFVWAVRQNGNYGLSWKG